MRGVRWIGFALGAVALGTSTASAQAAVTVGADLSLPNDASYACPLDVLPATRCTFAETSPAGQFVSPVTGVITRWRLKEGGNPDNSVNLRVIRPGATPGTFVGAGRSGPELTDSSSAAPQVFTTRLPIQAGDRIGLDGTFNMMQPINGGFAGTASNWQPELPEGGSGLPPNSNPAGLLLVNADVEADADHDGFGDETQDACPFQATTQGPCSNSFTVGRKPLKDGALQLTLTLPGPGSISAGDAGDRSLLAASAAKRRALVKRADASATGAGPVVLTLRPTKAAKRRLRTARSLKARVKVIYRPTGASPGEQVIQAKLRA